MTKKNSRSAKKKKVLLVGNSDYLNQVIPFSLRVTHSEESDLLDGSFGNPKKLANRPKTRRHPTIYRMSKRVGGEEEGEKSTPIFCA